MAELAKKLHFLKNGTEQTAKAYSTTSESGSSYITNVIDGVTCYVPLVGASDSRATVGRVLKSGTTYAIASSGKPAYTEKSWTTAGSYTWTAPAGVTRVRVAVCGGGGGAAGVSGYGTAQASSGGTTSFGNLISAGGGTGGYVKKNSSSTKWTAGVGGSPNGRDGSAMVAMQGELKGGAGFALSYTLTNGNYGKGGDVSQSLLTAATGGSGGYNSSYINVTAGVTYTISVGSGGASGDSSSGHGVVSAGNSGFVYIAYGGDI